MEKKKIKALGIIFGILFLGPLLLINVPLEAKQTPEQVRLRAYPMSPGTSIYTMFHAFADITKKNHPWLRLDIYDAKGSEANIRLLMDHPELRKNSIIYTTDYTNTLARESLVPFDKSYTDLRTFGCYSWLLIGLSTTDETIKTIGDLKGTTIAVGPRVATIAIAFDLLVDNVWHNRDQIRVVYSTLDGVKDAVIDGAVKVWGWTVNTVPGLTSTLCEHAPWMEEIVRSRRVYFIDVPLEDVAKMAKATGHPNTSRRVPKGFVTDYQPATTAYVTMSMGFWADKEMDEEIVYELTKTLVENIDKFKNYHSLGKLMSRESVARVPVPEELFHPGAIRYYNEARIPIGWK